MANKRYRVELVIRKEVVKIVTAKSEAQAISRAKTAIRQKHKVTRRDFEDCPEVEREP